MPTFKRCDKQVETLASTILSKHESHKPVLGAKVKIDLVFAYPDYDEKSGEPIGNALQKNGCKALGITRKIALKDRALGRGDAEISLDGHWWERADINEQEALLDHELHHIAVKIDKRGLVTDDLGRPVVQLRKHDAEFGWFKIIAERNGKHSIEQQQAKVLMDECGQSYWPDLFKQLKA